MAQLTKVFWLYGRSGAGKTTLGQRLRAGLADRDIPVIYLDGDELRASLCSDLGFKSEARLENHRRIAEIARLLAEQGLNVVVSTMAPEHSQRDRARRNPATTLTRRCKMWTTATKPFSRRQKPI